MPEIYLDNSATTRPLETVIDLMLQVYRSAYGNPSSLHAKGVEAEHFIREARARLASLLNSREDELLHQAGLSPTTRPLRLRCATGGGATILSPQPLSILR